MQYIRIEKTGKILNISNIHGLWNGQGKNDTEQRIEQSMRIKGFLEKLEGDIVLCGDFNLLPETKSISIIENIGLKNLIKEFNITSTRTSFYKKPLKFADYIFTSKNIMIKSFEVLPDEVSDHSPLIIEVDF